MDFTELVRRLWDPVSTPVLLAAGGLAAHLWQRYLKRLAVFRWSAWHSRLAIAGTDPNIGRIDVLWNDNPVQNLLFCNIEVENESSQDFTNVEVKLWYSDGTTFLGQGSLYGTTQFLPWATRYGAMVNTLLTTPPEQHAADDVHYVLTHREYTIPYSIEARGLASRSWCIPHRQRCRSCKGPATIRACVSLNGRSDCSFRP